MQNNLRFAQVYAVLCLFLFNVVGCTSIFFPEDDESGETLPLSGKLNIEVIEKVTEKDGDNVSSFTLSMETDYLCNYDTYYLWTKAESYSNTLEIELVGIVPEPSMLPVAGPAKGSIDLWPSNGTYEINMEYDSGWNNFHLAITDTSFQLLPGTHTFTNIDSQIAWRYKENSFVFFCSTGETSQWIYTDFVDMLLESERFTEFTFPENGKPPWNYPALGRAVDHPARYFTYSSEDDFVALESQFQAFVEENNPSEVGATFYVWNWKKEWYSSSGY